VGVFADLVNRMKTDLSEEDFRRMVAALARKFENGEFDESAFPLKPSL
jgi:hypothetical protein